MVVDHSTKDFSDMNFLNLSEMGWIYGGCEIEPNRAYYRCKYNKC